jgi:hypothetical protein
MEQLIVRVKDKRKLSFIIQLFKQMDFVEIELIAKDKSSKKHDIFNSAGMWAGKEISAKELRAEAWGREK